MQSAPLSLASPQELTPLLSNTTGMAPTLINSLILVDMHR
jgi:hypothetical protein